MLVHNALGGLIFWKIMKLNISFY